MMSLTLDSSLAASIVVKATITLALALIGAWFARRSRAAMRHTILTAAFGILLILPIASLLAPPVRIAVSVVQRAQIWPSDFANAIAAAPVPADPGAAVASSVPSRPSLPVLLLTTWLAGAILFLLPVVTGLWQVRLLRRSGLLWRRGQTLVNTLARDAGVQRRVEVLLHESLPGPMTCGVIHPAIALPMDARAWGGEDLTRAIVHELEHIRRGDWISHCIARVACAAYWFHPLVWIARRQLVLEAERSCDDAVLGRSDATAYADQLVGLARRMSVSAKSPQLAMANRSDLSARVRAVLDRRQSRGKAGTILVVLACAVAAALVLTLSPLRMVATPQSTPAQPAANAPAFEVASVKLRVNPTPPFAQINFGSDRLTLTEVNMSIGLMLAYGVRGYQIEGPDWMKDGGGSSFFDVAAKASHPVPDDQLRLMLRTLLAERFHMKLHWEKKEMPVLALLVAKGGPKFHATPPGTEVDAQFLGFNNVRHQGGRSPDGRGEQSFTNAPMAALATALSASMPFADPVLDMTGLPGRFDFVFHDAPHPAPGDTPNFEDMIAVQKTIVQDELGMTWERRKEPVDMLVVDHADKVPTEN